MISIRATATLSIVAACGVSFSTPATARPDATPRYDAATFYDTVSIFGSSFSPDENRILFTSDASGVFNVYSQPVGGGPPVQLTHSEADAVFGIGWFPNDDRFLYTADEGGNELNHVYAQTADGSVTDLTPGEGLKARFGGWSGDDTSFYVMTNERDARYFDVYRYDADDYDRTLVYRNEGGLSPAGVSRDGRWVALVRNRTNADDDLFLFDTRAPETAPVHVTPHDGDVSHGVADFTPDSRELYYTSNAEAEFSRLWAYDIETGESRLVEAADWDILGSRFSRSGRYRVTMINADARTELRVLDVTTGEQVDLPRLPAGDTTGVNFSNSGQRMAFYVNGDTSPSNLHVLDMKSGDVRPLTNTLNEKIDREHLVQSTVVRFPSFDGLEIPALLYRPHDATADNPAPGLVWVHGGPGGQSRMGYNAMVQFLVNHGYAVLSVNNRGSSGYGKTFFHLDDRRHGEDDLQDCIFGRRYLEGLDWVNGERVGIIGGSYGGYMVAAALTLEPEAFDVGIDIFGVTNWLRTLESIPSWWADFRESLYAEMGDPAVDSERLHRISPLFHADRVSRPLLVVQGANDPRVLKIESDELVDAVRQSGVPVEYVVFEDEGHGFRKRENRITAANAYLSFLERYLPGGSP